MTSTYRKTDRAGQRAVFRALDRIRDNAFEIVGTGCTAVRSGSLSPSRERVGERGAGLDRTPRLRDGPDCTPLPALSRKGRG